jgi:hypothetical protein
LSAFEFVLVAFAIVVGFGISEILGGWGEQIRARHNRTAYPLQIASSGLILYYSLQFLWGLWLLRSLSWTFPLYLFFSAPALAVALAAHITRVDTSANAAPASAQYFANSRPVYALMAMVPIYLIVAAAIPEIREEVRPLMRDAPNLIGLTLARLVALSLLLYLAWSRNAKHHWICLGVLWFAMVAMIIRLGFQL